MRQRSTTKLPQRDLQCTAEAMPTTLPPPIAIHSEFAAGVPLQQQIWKEDIPDGEPTGRIVIFVLTGPFTGMLLHLQSDSQLRDHQPSSPQHDAKDGITKKIVVKFAADGLLYLCALDNMDY